MSTKNETKSGPIKRLSLNRETVKSLKVRTAMRTGQIIATPTDDPKVCGRNTGSGVNTGASCPTSDVAGH